MVHVGPPPNCPDCGCQHKGELFKKPEPVVVGWECRNCGVIFNDPEGPCACETPNHDDRREIHDTDL